MLLPKVWILQQGRIPNPLESKEFTLGHTI